MSELIHYQVDWRASGVRPGAHVGRLAGNGTLFRGHGSLMDHADPRRIDARATARDPYRRMLVKIYQQNASLPVWVVADWSASMGFHGKYDKVQQIAEICYQLAWSTWRMGDRLGFVACNDEVRRDMLVSPRCSRQVGDEVRKKLMDTTPPDGGATGLKKAAGVMGKERSLVFLVSDFHFSSSELKAVLASLAHHDVVPVVLWDQAEFADIPRWGLGRVSDAESGEERLLWFRPSLRHKMQQGYQIRRQALQAVCRSVGRAPLLITNLFEPRQMTRYFLEPSSCD